VQLRPNRLPFYTGVVLELKDPGDRAPAPAPLRAVQAFVNTLDLEHGREVLAGPLELHELLVRERLLDSADTVTESDLRRSLELREALRMLLLANNGGRLDAESLEVLNRAARAAHLSVRFSEGGASDLEPEASGVDAALGRLVAIVYTAMAAGTWRRLKACRRNVCHWVFYDQSRNQSGTWCSMSVCGNRTKTKAYRRRSRGRR
jgi:predicted RNA-binding Zn ribbon-like protein